MGIEPTTSGPDLPSLCRLSYKVAQRKSGTILDGESRRRESKGTYECTYEFFTNIGPDLAKMIPSSTSSFRSFLSGSFINSFFLEPTTELEISEICASFRAGTSAGFDQVTMDVVKQTIDLIIGPLTHIMKLSLSSGIVPEQMKVARVIPLFKSGTLTLFTNYRPVSVLPAFSKFLEKIVYKRLDSFLLINIRFFLVISMALEKITLLLML